MRGIHKLCFPLVPQPENHLLVKWVHLCDRVMILHDACTSRTSWVLTVALLQRLKINVLIPNCCQLWSAVCDKVFECTECSTDQNSLSAVPGLWALTSWASRWCIAGADNLQLVDNMCKISAVGGHPSLWTNLWSMCRNALWRIVASQLWNSAVILQISHSLLHKIVTEHLLFRKLCARWCQSDWHQNTKLSAWSQHWHFCSGTMMTATGVWIAHITPGTKQQSLHWHHSGYPYKKKFK